jgi:uncharacterized protein YdbL (DUF1318 family)
MRSKVNNNTKRLLAGIIGLSFMVGIIVPGYAQSGADPIVEQARSAGQVGEQADGYLGSPQPLSGDLKARVDQINIKRRAVYTDLAAQRGVTVLEVGAATACEQFKSRIGVGHVYRDENGAWLKNTPNTPVKLPSFCPR